MNNLAGMRCYLAGAMENTSDNGSKWREQVKQNLSYLGIQWLDPYHKPIEYGRENQGDFAEMKKKRSCGEFVSIRKFMQKIRAVDLRMVDVSDFLIVYLDPDIPTFGTHEEVARAASQNKPVIVMIKGGIQKAPLWWFAMLDWRLFFTSWKAVQEYLETISRIAGAHMASASDGRWLPFDLGVKQPNE